MRFTKVALFPAAALALASLAAAQTIPPPTGYLRTICTKVKPGKAADIEKLFADTVLKSAEQQIKDGKMLRFAFSRAVVPTGDAAQCDYIGSYLYATFPPEPSRENAEAAFAAAKVGTYGAFIDKYLLLGHTVRSDFWAMRGSLGSSAKGDFFYAAWVKYSNFPAYFDVQTKYGRPMAELRVKDGRRKGWALYTRIVPTGSDEKVNAAVVEVMGPWEAVAQPPIALQEDLKKIGANMTNQEFIDFQNKSSALVQRALYKVVLSAGAMPAK